MNLQGIELSDETMLEIVEDGRKGILYFHSKLDMKSTEGEKGHIVSMMAYMGFLEAVIDKTQQEVKIYNLLKP